MTLAASLQVQPTGTRDVTFTRDFRAPRPLVWRAMTEPALILRWLWAKDFPMSRCEQDFRPGGTLRWEWSLPGNRIMGVSGRYLEVQAPERIVHTELFDEDWTGGETRVTTLLEDHGPTLTRMRMTVEYSSPAAREGALSSGMVSGMVEAYDRLDGLLPEWADAEGAAG